MLSFPTASCVVIRISGCLCVGSCGEICILSRVQPGVSLGRICHFGCDNVVLSVLWQELSENSVWCGSLTKEGISERSCCLLTASIHDF